MKARGLFHNHVVAALLPLILLAGAPARAEDSAKLAELMARLKTAEQGEAKRIERQIWLEWSKSGSPSMDLLLQRGRDAIEAGDTDAAIGHLTALIDHDPDFAEGYNARAIAYYSAGEFGPAFADLGQVLTLNPQHFGAISGLASMLEQVGKPEQALDVWRKAKAIHPNLAGVDDAIKRLEQDAAGREL